MAATWNKTNHYYQMIRHFRSLSTPGPVSLSKAYCLLHQNQQRRLFTRLPNTKKNLDLVNQFSLFLSRAGSSLPKYGLVEWYLGLVKTRPVATKSITSAFIYTAADFSSQAIEAETSEGYDLVRTLRMAGYGMLILGPSLHYWFNFVSLILPKRDLSSTFKKMALGQGVFGPAMTVIFFSVNAALQGETGSEIVARLKRDFIPATISGIMYWPVCDFMTFKFFPVHLQPLVSNSFTYLWTVYMTYMASLEKVVTN